MDAVILIIFVTVFLAACLRDATIAFDALSAQTGSRHCDFLSISCIVLGDAKTSDIRASGLDRGASARERGAGGARIIA
jgi:hypothetical protein